MDLRTRFSKVEKWLEECLSKSETSHKSCSSLSIEIKGYPSRLLGLDEAESSGHVQLVDTKNWSNPKPEYTTLSHCWGNPGPRPLKTTNANLSAHMSQIRLAELPKTFRDAVNITRRLGQKYLWIDSLCIIQDDEKDWQQEASLMAAIYENSFLTVAATSAENCEGGCGLEPWTWHIIEAHATTGDGKYRNLQPRTRYQMKLKRVGTTSKRQSPLYTRGWALQELLLSRRVLYMANDHMRWKCQHIRHREDLETPLKLDQPIDQLLGDWSRVATQDLDIECSMDMIEKYSRMEFTYSRDRIPAFAGITHFQAARLKDEPLLGLWATKVARDLAWYSCADSRARLSGLPTWSWLSSKHVNFLRCEDVLVYQLLLKTWDIKWTGQPYVSTLMSSTLSVGTMIHRTVIDATRELNKAVVDNFHNSILLPFLSTWRVKEGRADILRNEFYGQDDENGASRMTWPISDVVLDEKNSLSGHPKTMSITYMLLWTSAWQPGRRYRKEPFDAESVCFLALRKRAGKSSAYVRIGCGIARLFLSRDLRQTDWMNWRRCEFLEHLLRTWEEATIELH